MSTLKVNDIIEATSGGGKAFQCRAWVKFTMTLAQNGLQGDQGVSSVIDQAVGDFDISLTNTMSDANYSLAGYTNAYNNNTSNFSSAMALGLGTDYSSSTYGQITTGFSFCSYAGASVDGTRNYAQAFGNLA